MTQDAMPQTLPRVALYQPDIAGNTGAILRTAACIGFAVDLIEPAGFDASDRALRRAGMDYLEMAFLAGAAGRRIVIATTKGAVAHTEFAFSAKDTLLFGRESSGLPETIHALSLPSVTIRMRPGARSLNLSVSCAIIAAEAARQLGL
jgi:tRNA (cytidine/uridine-2'-O-)-methyltransferase